MGSARTSSSSRVALAILLLCMTLVGQSYAQLKNGFYLGKCRKTNVEKDIFDVVNAAYKKDRSIVAALLRMQFHDCFVRGCDASILLDGSNSEKTDGSNASVRGYELIDACKASLEKKCPGVVSCADIIVIATRVAVFLAQGRWYNVETGRRDGLISRASEAQANLPGPTIPVPVAIDIFRRRGLSADDFVLLLGGGHTVGVLHCNFFLDRLYNFQNSGKPDKTMNPTTLSAFRKRCPRSGSNNFVFADQTKGSEFKVDKGYYNAITQGKGVLQIDQQIALHPATSGIVRRLSVTGDFAFQFGGAMVRLGRVGVLTGSKGQIRKNCRRLN
ncbi:peroxidase 44-like [Amaranthus tricolor]|uniref:peroxidase 44-like n=1 Tax=Amaranthus tricolor TaxID=29722 RepID=UPI00258534D3|nr:peroxidase 44-like [Amaranthus tricolor]